MFKDSMLLRIAQYRMLRSALSSRLTWSMSILISALLCASTASATTYVWQSTVDFQSGYVKGVDAVSVCQLVPQFWNDTNTYNISADHLGAPAGPGLANDCVIKYPSGIHAYQNNSNLISVGLSPSIFVSAEPEKKAEPVKGCHGKSLVGDPINPATGAVSNAEQDCLGSSGVASLELNRFYESSDSVAAGIGLGWHLGYSRSIAPVYQTFKYKPYLSSDPNVSALYDDETTACTSGFAQIQSRVSSWLGAAASFENNACVLRRNGVYLTTLPLYYTSSLLLAPTPAVIGYSVIRDDGQTIRFSLATNVNGEFLAPSGVTLRLRTVAEGFSIADESDNVELYNASGQLLSITSRTGFLQTMSYDTSGRLSGVTDSFGHQLTLSYDSQSRLITVTRQ